jgi:hypothetical protein
MFKKHGRRTWMSLVHANMGRVVIFLGMVNGGLGLKLASAPKKDMIAYGVCAGVMGVVYLAAITFGEVKQAKKKPAPTGMVSNNPMSNERVSKEDFQGARVESSQK